MLQLTLFQRQVCRLPHSAAMVAREGSAPSISGCRPDVILFHHRAKTVWMPRLDSHQDRRGQSPACCCYTTRRGLACRAVARRQRESPPVHFVLRRGSLRPSLRNGRRLVEPEVVATSPNRIKSPVPVCCGFDSMKLVLAAGFAPALATLSTSRLFCWTTRAREMDPPAG